MVGHFHGTGNEIWAGFGLVGITEKEKNWANYEQLLRPVYSQDFRVKRKKIKNIVASALKSCME